MKWNQYLVACESCILPDSPNDTVMAADVLLRGCHEEMWQLDLHKEGKITGLPAHIQEVEESCLHTG